MNDSRSTNRLNIQHYRIWLLADKNGRRVETMACAKSTKRKVWAGTSVRRVPDDVGGWRRWRERVERRQATAFLRLVPDERIRTNCDHVVINRSIRPCIQLRIRLVPNTINIPRKSRLPIISARRTKASNNIRNNEPRGKTACLPLARD